MLRGRPETCPRHTCISMTAKQYRSVAAKHPYLPPERPHTESPLHPLTHAMLNPPTSFSPQLTAAATVTATVTVLPSRGAKGAY